MNLAMYNLSSNLKSSLHKTWQTLLSFLKPHQIQTLKRRKWGDMAYYIPHLKKWGDTSPVFPTILRPSHHSWLCSRLQTTPAQIARIGPKWMYTVLNIFFKECLWEYIYIARKKWYLIVDGYLSFPPKWISSDQLLEAFVLVREMLLLSKLVQQK